jgi:acetolactate synthase regulatory subunit
MIYWRDGLEGGPPARSDGVPEGVLPAGPEVVLVLVDRLDALERALGTVRRRGMSLKVLTLSRWGDELILVLRGGTGAPVPDRWVAELGALVDVRHVRVVAEPQV